VTASNAISVLWALSGVSYLREGLKQNPAQLLFQALDQSDLEARVTEALPWLVLTFPEMNLEWLVNR
jgi:hypothetical protein